MPVAVSQHDILVAVGECFICESHDLVPINRERILHTHALNDPDVADILRPYAGRTFMLNRCRKCGFLQPEGLPIEARYFEALYDQKWSEEWMLGEFFNPYKEFIFEGILTALEDRLPPGRRTLLDVGAHVGRMIFLASNRGWQADGLELNNQTRLVAMRMTGRPVHRLTAKELAATGVRYDAIAVTDVLEHIPNPVGVLTDLRELLRPGGWISIKVPCGVNQLRKQRIRKTFGKVGEAEVATSMVHINHFSPTALGIALSRAGFARPRMGVGAPELPPGGGIRGWADRRLRRFVFAAARLPLALHTPLALNLQAFAQNAVSCSVNIQP